MKILYDHQAFSLQSTGGITRYFLELMRRLSQIEGVKLSPLLGFYSTPAAICEVAAHGGRAILWSYPSLSPGLRTYAINEALLSAVAITAGRFDIYHNTLYRYMPFVRARRHVATHHDCIQERFPELFKDRERIFKAKRRMFHRSDLVFCVSESSRVDLEEFYGIGPDRTKVVYNGVSQMQRTPKGRDELRKISDREFILYVGKREGYKNFSGLVKAMQVAGVFGTHRLLALGGGPLSADEKPLVRDLGSGQAITVVPQASSDLLAECYASADLFVYPSLYEGFGLPPLEAMQVGCPTLVARSSATSEVCRDGAFFFDPYVPEEFSEMLKVSLFDSSAREAMIGRGLEVAKRYSWDRTAEEVMAGYQAIL